MSDVDPTDNLHVVRVFAVDGYGGNPATIGLDADALSTADMLRIAQLAGHECSFVLAPPAAVPAPPARPFDATFRFFVPKHEMEMCGHATIGALWLLHRLGRLPANRDRIEISTLSGPVTGRIDQTARPFGRADSRAQAAAADHRGTSRVRIAISQPRGHISPLPDATAHAQQIADVLGIASSALAPRPIVNARTSRAKTLVPLISADALHALQPDFERMEALCETIGSTGLYTYAVIDRERRIFEARQFPKASGYPEDPATGIAASALAFGLLDQRLVTANDAAISIYQGRAMGQLSRIEVSFQPGAAGCWITGDVAQPS